APNRADTEIDVRRFAAEIGIGTEQLDACLDEGRLMPRIREQIAVAQRLGVDSTPTFFFAVVDTDRRVQLRYRLTGAQPYDTFRSIIASMTAPVRRWSSLVRFLTHGQAD